MHTYCGIEVLGFDEKSATEYQRLRKERHRLSTMDLKIAAIVLAHDATLLTRNLVDFQKISGLKVEDWSKPEEFPGLSEPTQPPGLSP